MMTPGERVLRPAAADRILLEPGGYLGVDFETKCPPLFVETPQEEGKMPVGKWERRGGARLPS